MFPQCAADYFAIPISQIIQLSWQRLWWFKNSLQNKTIKSSALGMAEAGKVLLTGTILILLFLVSILLRILMLETTFSVLFSWTLNRNLCLRQKGLKGIYSPFFTEPDCSWRGLGSDHSAGEEGRFSHSWSLKSNEGAIRGEETLALCTDWLHLMAGIHGIPQPDSQSELWILWDVWWLWMTQTLLIVCCVSAPNKRSIHLHSPGFSVSTDWGWRPQRKSWRSQNHKGNE